MGLSNKWYFVSKWDIAFLIQSSEVLELDLTFLFLLLLFRVLNLSTWQRSKLHWQQRETYWLNKA